MRPQSALVNTLWLASGITASRRFARALHAPAEAQAAWLAAALARHAGCEYGRRYEFAALRTPADFARTVPLSDASDLAGWIPRIQAGDRNLLTAAPVTHLAPTSGSSGARKLVPFTAGLQASFATAVSAWMADLVRARPALLGGPAYWSVSPLSDADDALPAPGGVRVGFADDAEYLGGWAGTLVRQVMAVPASVRHVRDEEAFRCLTLLAMLRQAELRLISVWHPSFLELLVSAAPRHWDQLLDAIAFGTLPWGDALPPASRAAWRAPANAARARALRHIGAEQWPRWWPALQVVSCWGDQAAAAGHAALERRLPGVLVQSKGLLATEAVVTVPVHGAYPVALTSHFFEFLDDGGSFRLAHELEDGGEYEVVVTNGAGLWRYRLGDVVECAGHLGAAPSLRFLGRTGNVSDLRGEKLAEPFVAGCLRALWDVTGTGEAPELAELHAMQSGGAAWYELRLSAGTSQAPAAELAARLDDLLRANPHYALARRLGQLASLRVTLVSGGPHLARPARERMRLGDIKPRTLVGVPRAGTVTGERQHG
ncbi:MAG: GH3 auxin-responsive promoter family protein [Gemmatimonadaceae bacterium]|nr:GH3 auxin-responsive promoter family protein [Gemmatimonadaceae bacterium]